MTTYYDPGVGSPGSQTNLFQPVPYSLTRYPPKSRHSGSLTFDNIWIGGCVERSDGRTERFTKDSIKTSLDLPLYDGLGTFNSGCVQAIYDTRDDTIQFRSDVDFALKYAVCAYDPDRRVPKRCSDKISPIRNSRGASLTIRQIAALASLYPEKGNQFCKQPIGIECYDENGDEAKSGVTCNARKGFSCRGSDCKDYKIKICCPESENICERFPRACSPTQKCEPRYYAHDCECAKGYTMTEEGDCVDLENQCKCGCSGDPHCYACQRFFFDFMGPCRYLAITNNCPHTGRQFPSVEVITKHKPCGKKSKKVTCTESMQVRLCETRVRYIAKDCIVADLSSRRGGCTLTKRPSNNWLKNKISVRMAGRKCVFKGYGLKLDIRGSKWNSVIDSKFKGRMCGLCGKWSNGEDFIINRKGEPFKFKLNERMRRINGKKRPVNVINRKDSATYGDQWLYTDPDSPDDRCTKPTELGDECTDEEFKEGLKTCAYFKTVAGLLKDDDYEDFMNGCAQDACSGIENAVCEALNSYVDKKVAELGIKVVPEWKNKPDSPCPISCSKDNERPSLGFLKQPYCDGTEYKGVMDCVCEMGYVFDQVSTKCVTQDECSCTTDSGIPLQPRQTIYNTKDCTEKQRCTNGRIETEDSEASPEANCTIDELIGCKDGYDGDGKVCTASTDSCIAGWKKSSQGCVKEFDDKTNFPLAAQRCREESGELVAAANDADSDTILDLVKDNPGEQFFIAGVCKDSSVESVQDGQTSGAQSYIRPKLAGVPACSDKDTPECFVASSEDGSSLKIEKISCFENKKFICVKKPEEDFEQTPWCNSDTPEAGEQEEENPTTMRKKDCATCENPRGIECRTADTQKPSSEFSDTKCNLEDFFLGEQCAKDETCDDFEVRMLCPKRLDECKKKVHLCNSDETCEDTEFGYVCLCSPDNIEVIKDGKTSCKDVKQCLMEQDSPGDAFAVLPFDSPDNPLFLERNCDVTILSTADCDKDEDKEGRTDVSIRISKRRRISLTIKVDSNTIRISNQGVVRLNGGIVQDGAISQDSYSLEVTGDSIFKFQTSDQNIRCFFVFNSGLRRMACLATDYYNPSCGICTVGSNDVSTQANVKQFFEKNSLPGSSCLPPPGQETETTIATFGTPVVITTPETVTTIAAPSASVPTTSEPGQSTETPVCANPNPKCDEIGEALKKCEGADDIVGRCVKETCGRSDVCSFVTDVIRALQSAYDRNEEKCSSVAEARRAVKRMRRLTDCDESPAIPACKSAKWRRRYAAPPLPKTCAYPFRSDESVGANNLDVTCVCIPGYVLKPIAGASGMECVPIAECGCRYKTQYLEIGEYYEDRETCTGTQLCSEFNTIVPANKSCTDNAECKDGKCVCDEGYMGDGVELCQKEIDYPEKKCSLVYDSTAGINRLKCECKMGYASACETCVDIDECATGENNCGEGTKCSNLPGSYQCDCKPGYARESNTTCKDIKECESNPCPENSICYEGQGSYYCKCCEGFQKNGDKCEAIDKSNPPKKCCTCVLPQCSVAPNGNADAGCYVENGEETSYDSFHTAFIYRCIKNLPFKVDDYKYKPCSTPVEIVTTTTPGSLPTTTPPAEATTAPPDPCRDTAACNLSDENDKKTGPVCSAKNVRFPNLCAFKQAECRGNNNTPKPELPAYTRGECPTTTPPPTSADPTNPFIWGPWGPYEPCDAPDCDTPGRQTRERDYTLSPGAPDIVPPESERVSFISCKKPGCTPKPTAPPTTLVPEQCGVLDCSSEINPVCGAIANGSPATYDSECRLLERACKSTPRSVYRIINRSKCKDEEGEPEPPKLCNGIPTSMTVRRNITHGDKSCYYEVEMNVCESLQCVNPAGSTSSNICCRAVRWATEKIQVNALCTDNSFEQIHLQNPEACECQDDGAP